MHITLDIGELGILEAFCNHIPKQHPSEPEDEFEIIELWVNGHRLSEPSKDAWLEVYMHHSPRRQKPDRYALREIIEFKAEER